MKHSSGPIYAYEPWTVTEQIFDVEQSLRSETIFAVANGYLGMRGNFEEGYYGPVGSSYRGTYINGFYESAPIIYGEEGYGYARERQTMLNVADAQIIRIWVEDEPLHIFHGSLFGYHRQLDMRKGIVTRTIQWQSPEGRQIEVVFERMASLADPNLLLIRCKIRPMNFDGSIRIESAIEGGVVNQVSAGDPRSGSSFSGPVLNTLEMRENETYTGIAQRTRVTGFHVTCAAEHRLHGAEYTVDTEAAGSRVEKRFNLSAESGQEIVLEKYIAYHASEEPDVGSLWTEGIRLLDSAMEQGFDEYARKQEEILDEFWLTADVRVEGDAALQQGLRFSAYHLFQSVGRDGRTNMAAKGLTGEGYEGHYFWDTEIYVLPFFLQTVPDIARKLLDYRHYILPEARNRAEELGFKGALFPWRTIGGEETSAYFPAGTAQIHIDADIAHAVKLYNQAARDTDYMYGDGLEILVETCRFFASFGQFIPGRGFCINGVTGPDEYTALVNNNTYTNVMVRDGFHYTVDLLEELRSQDERRFDEVTGQFGVTDGELGSWKKMADEMYIHREHGMIGQDDSFLQKAVWDFAGTPQDKHPLLLHFHPMVIYRSQVLKQADLVLAFHLQPELFTRAEKARGYLYYEGLTTHDSSLSSCAHSMVAAELGYLRQAYDFFMDTARLDLDDTHNNVKDGIHAAAMAGSRLAIVNGFAGMKQDPDKLSFRPVLPEEWLSYGFAVQFQGRKLRVDVGLESTVYRLLEGEPMPIEHFGVETLLHDKLTLPNRVLAGVLFDLDGVITDTAELHYQAWKELADSLNIPFDREYNEKLKGVDRMASLKLILDNGDVKLPPEEMDELATRKNERYKELLETLTPDALLPGVRKLLKALRREGIGTALASASRNAPTVLDRLGVTDLFDYVADAGAVALQKPDAEIFLAAAEGLGVHPMRCIGIEDAAAGIMAIHRAGMPAIGIGTRKSLPRADHVVATPADLNPALLREWMLTFSKKDEVMDIGE
ncbi:beta-phosphoglucomutase [Saccharibacillus sp. CPCC 101409]|uniref:beta-phosphoglucomutase n=1 Tax=Saccharibacillus sp. CPCC 101409 TaxID=3058041 RepID=UPI002673114F|nr:beta-phosphoglucomutase [Saccharibacillus sp. CPCC 101409]MDO3411386.1 beta-phosphoglucomutase [Saccharibacillus sp. CPCC 101409]